MKNYAGNIDFLNEYKNIDLFKKFPIYGTQIQERMSKGFERREIFDKSCTLLSDCLPIFNPTHLVVRDILDYVTSKKDLLTFCTK